MRLFFFSLFILVVMTWTPAVGAGQKQQLRVYTELGGNVAFRESGRLTGYGVELLRELMNRVGNSNKVEAVPWMRGYDALLRDPNVALIPTTLTEERRELFYWVGPILHVEWMFLARKGEGHMVTSMEDAKGVSAIGTYLGDAREQYLKEQGFTNLQSTYDLASNFRKLASGRVDLVLATNVGFEATAELVGIPADTFETALVLSKMQLYIAISRKTQTCLVEKWRNEFRHMREDGTLQRIFTKWYPDQIAPSQ